MANKLVCPHCGAPRGKKQAQCRYCGSALEVEHEEGMSRLEEKTERFMENVFDGIQPALEKAPKIIGIVAGIIFLIIGPLLVFFGLKLGNAADAHFSAFSTLARVIPITIGVIMAIVGISLLIAALKHRKK